MLQVTSIRLSGVLRMIPVPSENLLAWAFVQPPQLEIGLSASVGGVSMPQFDLLSRVVADTVRQHVSEPRRKIAALRVSDNAPHGVQFGRCSVQVAAHSLHGAVFGAHNFVALHVQLREVRSCPSRSV